MTNKEAKCTGPQCLTEKLSTCPLCYGTVLNPLYGTVRKRKKKKKEKCASEECLSLCAPISAKLVGFFFSSTIGYRQNFPAGVGDWITNILSSVDLCSHSERKQKWRDFCLQAFWGHGMFRGEFLVTG